MEHASARAKAGAWVCGFVSYEAAPAFQPYYRVPPRFADFPLAWFAEFTAPAQTSPSDAGSSGHAIDRTSDVWPGSEERDRARMWWCGLAQPHRVVVEGIRQSIARGDVYQVNATGRLVFTGNDHPGQMYERLCRAQAARYSAWLHIGAWDILSVSPELFYARNGMRIVTRPMKGTSPRAPEETEDRAQRAYLEQSEKELAENLMIVDLLRNDLGQIAEPGSVRVDELFAIEAYPTVWQMTSTISGHLRPEANAVDIFRALFPCGSVTGAPKAAAMKAIAECERVPRGVYCGAIGLWTPDDREVWSVAIRTLVGRRDRATWVYGVGSGVTWDSRPAQEEAEVKLKAAVIDRAGLATLVELLETMRLEDGVWFLYDEHRARALTSARTLHIPLDPHVFDDALRRCRTKHPTGTWRVRVRVSLRGEVHCEASPWPNDPFTTSVVEAGHRGEPRIMAISSEPVDRRSLWLYHKTTDRRYYDRMRRACPGAFDVLLYNEDGEVTEGTFGNIAYEWDGVWYTPPVECGLLPGTLRSHLLRRQELRERVLHLSEVGQVTRWCWLNGLRGIIPVVVATWPTTRSETAVGEGKETLH
ncbi:aminodeoxychorismate synthase component I [Alicyclobacillus vulcanalis]|nr:aminodeoxychorismate synthase component I [Alicyclobacillus vulcanalis]